MPRAGFSALGAPVPSQLSIPRSLRKPPHDWGLAAGAVLTIVAPLTVLRFGFDLYEGVLTGLVGIAGTGLGFWLLVYVATDLLGHRLGPSQRVLFADAAAGQVHAVRVRIGAPVGNGTRSAATSPARPRPNTRTGSKCPRSRAAHHCGSIRWTRRAAAPA